LDRLQSATAVRDVAGTTYFPMSGNTALAALEINGTTRDVFTNYTTPGFFELMKVPLVTGRLFSAADTRGSTPVVIVNEMLARRIRADGDVIGRQILVKSESGPAAVAAVERTIVGVIANTRSSGVHTRSRDEAYVPYAQNPVAALQIVAEARPGREAEAALQLRSAVSAIRPELVVGPPRAMEVMIRQRMGTTPIGAWILGVIAVLACGLAAIGLMATIGWWVRQRTRELGVRIALGATRAVVMTMVFRQGMALASVGVLAGCAGAAGLTRYLAGWIYGVTPLDPSTFAACAVLMLVVAACAVYFPVRRATSVDPVVALRAE
jgi:putative ABC transport system permease protein